MPSALRHTYQANPPCPCYNYYLSTNFYLPLQWYVSTLTVPKSILLIIHSTNVSIIPLMKLTSLLLVETLTHSDHIMVYAANITCIDNIVSAKSSQRILIERCINTELQITSIGINVCAACK